MISELELSLDHLGNRPVQQALYLLHFLIQIDWTWLGVRFSAEYEEIADKFGSALGSVKYLLKVGIVGMVLLLRQKENLGISLRDREQIVEVMGNAPG